MSAEWDAVPVAGATKDIVADWNAIPVAATKTQPQYSPLGTDKENFMAGAGKYVSDTGLRVKQLMDIPAVWLEKKFPGLSRWAQENMGTPSAAESAGQTTDRINEAKALDAPLMATKAGIAGNITSAIGTNMIGLGALSKSPGVMAAPAKVMLNPATYKAAAAAGALQGALTPVAEGESGLRNMVVGGALGVAGNAVVNTIGRIAIPVKKVLSVAYEKAVSTLENAGIPLDAAQKSGSTFLRKLSSSFGDNPFTAGAQAEKQAAQQAGFNRAVLQQVGENAIAATPEVMNSASRRINGVFNDVLGRNNVAVNDAFVGRIADIQKAANDVEKKPISNLANRILSSMDDNGEIQGQVAYAIKKDLDRISNTADSTLNYYARTLNSALKDQISASLPESDRAAFDLARKQFARMKSIEGAIDREGGGNISPAKLAAVFATKANRNVSIYGRGDRELVDLAQAGNMLLRDKTPNSGTVPRAVMQLLPSIALGGAVGGEEGWRSGDWDAALTRGLMTAATVAAIPKAAQMMINNPKSAEYLANGMVGRMTPLAELLKVPQTSPVVGGALKRLPLAYKGASQ